MAELNYSRTGKLKFQITSSVGLIPIENAKIRVYEENNTENPIEVLTTDSVGKTETIELMAPNKEYSETPSTERPYQVYDMQITAEGYEEIWIRGTEILPDCVAIQPAEMQPLEITTSREEIINIPAHTLYGNYPPKIPEAEIKPINESGEIVLSRVVIPEYIVVHDGVPNDSSAKNYYVRYTDYIKNVVSSEIYATWPEDAIYANIYAILSFTLNRVYTEWYRNIHLFMVAEI